MKRVISIVLSVAFLFLSLMAFGGCYGAKESAVAMSYDEITISEDIYRYWLCMFKSYYVQTYSDITDTISCWNSDMGNGTTIGEYVENHARLYAETMVCTLKLFEHHGMTLSDEVYNDIDDSISEIIRYKYDSSKSKFNRALMDSYGIDIDELRRIFIMEKKADMVEKYLFGTNGVMLPKDNEIDSFYNENYVHIQAMVIKTAFDYVYDKDGNIAVDASGQYQTVKYTAEQAAAKKALAEAVYESALSGENFSDLVAQNDEYFQSNQEDGYYFCAYDLDTMIERGYSSSTLSEIFKMEEGTVMKFEDSEAVYIVKRVPLSDKAYSKAESGSLLYNVSTHACTYKYDRLIAEMSKNIIKTSYVDDLKIVDVNMGIL